MDKKGLGIKIRQARKLYGEKHQIKFNQQNLADKIEVSRSYIGDIETGRTYPSIIVLKKISEACELPFGFFDDTNGIKDTSPENDERELMNIIKQSLKDSQTYQFDAFACKISTLIQNSNINLSTTEEQKILDIIKLTLAAIDESKKENES